MVCSPQRVLVIKHHLSSYLHKLLLNAYSQLTIALKLTNWNLKNYFLFFEVIVSFFVFISNNIFAYPASWRDYLFDFPNIWGKCHTLKKMPQMLQENENAPFLAKIRCAMNLFLSKQDDETYTTKRNIHWAYIKLTQVPYTCPALRTEHSLPLRLPR